MGEGVGRARRRWQRVCGAQVGRQVGRQDEWQAAECAGVGRERVRR